MGRPREFDRDAALDIALREFWSRGYQSPTMSELRLAMGIGRQSLYSTFGDKEQLFREALERYVAMSGARSAQILGGEEGLAAVRTYLLETASGLADDPDRKGCLMFNTCMGVAPHDAEVQAVVRRGLDDLRRRFEGALRQAVERDELPADAEVKKLAVFLVSQVSGMVVLARGGFPKKDLRAAATVALAHLQ